MAACLSLCAATGASGAYSVQSRFSEVSRTSYRDGTPTVVTSLASTTSLDPFAYSPYQTSSLSANGAAYSGMTTSSGGHGPPSGSVSYGQYEISSFQLVFQVSTPQAFSLSGSLRRYFGATSVLKLEALTPGGSPTLSASATGSTGNNFAPDLVNWSGTLATGTYRLSILERGETWFNSIIQETHSSFAFTVPSPGALALLSVALFPRGRRRA